MLIIIDFKLLFIFNKINQLFFNNIYKKNIICDFIIIYTIHILLKTIYIFNLFVITI